MSDYFMTDRERELEARRREREAVQPPATPQETDEVADFWREVERSYDIEPRAFFEKEAKLMGYSSAVAMAMHHMWKRDVKDRDGQTIKARASTPSPEGQTWHEEWRGVVGYEGRYEVSCFGRVRKLGGPIVGQWRKSAGYYQVRLSEPRAVHLVHRLVAKAFIPNHENKPGVNHIDFDTINNAVANLEWCTQAENIQHSAKAGRMNRPEMRGKRPTVAAFTDEQVAAMRQQYAAGGETWSSLAAKFGVSKRTVGRILRREVYSYV